MLPRGARDYLAHGARRISGCRGRVRRSQTPHLKLLDQSARKQNEDAGPLRGMKVTCEVREQNEPSSERRSRDGPRALRSPGPPCADRDRSRHRDGQQYMMMRLAEPESNPDH